VIQDTRPWGHFDILSDEPDHKVKRLVVEPGKRLSLQRHQQRSEHWFVVAGTPEVTRDEAIIRLGPGDAIDIPQGSLHRIANPGQDRVVIIEIQRGTYFGEDDIERVEDDFGRI